MLKISDFSRIAQVSSRTLRYYDDLGLLSPQVTDTATGYRYYAMEQLSHLNRILALKDLGFGLDQIASLIDKNTTTEQMRHYLLRQEQETQARMLADAERLRRIRNRLEQIEHANDPILLDVVIKSADAQPAIGNRMIVPSQPDLMFFTNHMLAEIYRWLRQNHINPSGAQYVLYQGEEYSDDDIDTEVIVTLPSTPRSLPPFPHEAMRLRELPAEPLMVTTVYQGYLQEAGQTIRDLIRWCEQSGYRLATGLNTLRELHLFQEIDVHHPIPLSGTIEFQLPVERIQA
jgi:DNA-binding transcriptional MerR regulator